ncbi:MAG TPA: hypothetical protein VFZ52_17350 [Chryseolinea sp.]
MIVIKSLRLLQGLSYMLVTSQVLFYLFILSDALKAVSLASYFEQRKVIDSLMINRFRAMYYSCLVLTLLTVGVSAIEPTSIFFMSAALALIFLSVDLFITIKYSLPLNALSRLYGTSIQDVNWIHVRDRWLSCMKYRGIAITLGMASVLAGLVFEKH